MSNDNVVTLHSFNDLVSPQSAAQALRRTTVLQAIQNIENNLDDQTVTILKRFLLKWLDSGSVLCVLQNREIDYLIEVLEQEKLYRENHREIL